MKPRSDMPQEKIENKAPYTWSSFTSSLLMTLFLDSQF